MIKILLSSDKLHFSLHVVGLGTRESLQWVTNKATCMVVLLEPLRCKTGDGFAIYRQKVSTHFTNLIRISIDKIIKNEQQEAVTHIKPVEK